MRGREVEAKSSLPRASILDGAAARKMLDHFFIFIDNCAGAYAAQIKNYGDNAAGYLESLQRMDKPGKWRTRVCGGFRNNI